MFAKLFQGSVVGLRNSPEASGNKHNWRDGNNGMGGQGWEEADNSRENSADNGIGCHVIPSCTRGMTCQSAASVSFVHMRMYLTFKKTNIVATDKETINDTFSRCAWTHILVSCTLCSVTYACTCVSLLHVNMHVHDVSF